MRKKNPIEIGHTEASRSAARLYGGGFRPHVPNPDKVKFRGPNTPPVVDLAYLAFAGHIVINVLSLSTQCFLPLVNTNYCHLINPYVGILVIHA